ncbi:MAG: hypothetical protein ACI9HY_003370 [Planctomycetaceae bacterium]|jgi:hypothetical protein
MMILQMKKSAIKSYLPIQRKPDDKRQLHRYIEHP